MPEKDRQKKNPSTLFRFEGFFMYLAERVGFEPTVRYNRTPDFESGAFDLSATFPSLLLRRSLGRVPAKQRL
jgi:hypothetical protein